MVLLLYIGTVVPVHALELVGFRTEPATPIAGEPFSITLLLDFVSCIATIEELAIVGSTIRIVGAGGPPLNGGCGGVLSRNIELEVDTATDNHKPRFESASTSKKTKTTLTALLATTDGSGSAKGQLTKGRHKHIHEVEKHRGPEVRRRAPPQPALP